MTLSTQFITILVMIACGVYLGAAVDTLRRFEHHWKQRTIFPYIVEISFWLLQTLVLFYVLFLSNQGELRFYIFLAILCGYAAYRSLFQTVYQKTLNGFIRVLISIFRFMKRIGMMFLVRPVLWILRLLFGILLWGGGVMVWVAKILFQILFYPIRLLLRFIYNILPNKAKNYLNKMKGFYRKVKNIVSKWWKKINWKD